MCSGVRLKSMAQRRTRQIFDRQQQRNQADKRRRVFTIVGDARSNGRIRPNKVARASQRHNLEREAVADAFEGAFGVQ